MIIIKAKSKAKQERERGREEETYLGHETGEPDLTLSGFNALFYRPCPRGHQRSQLSSIPRKMIYFRYRSFLTGLTQPNQYIDISCDLFCPKDSLLKQNKPKYIICLGTLRKTMLVRTIAINFVFYPYINI